jgi:DNA polymerase-3 subunit gamma/tau
LALVNTGARDSFVSSRSHEYVQQALHDVLGVTWRIEPIVDPGAHPPGTQPADAPPPAPAKGGVTSPDTVRDAMRSPAEPEDQDAAAHPDDPVVDSSGDDPEQLLSRELGAHVIDEPPR